LNATDNWAAWLDGHVTITGVGYIPGGPWQPSDETLKTNVQPLEGAREVLAQLNAKTYEFLVDAHPGAGLPSGFQSGLMSQEVEEVLPHLVRDINIPEQLDDDGNMVHPAETLKAMNYGGLIPYLIAAFNEQAERLDQLEQALASCCSRTMNEGGTMEAPVDEKGLNGVEGDRLLTIAPNPFTDRTSIRYPLERGGRTMLLVNSSDGKQLQVLQEAVKQAGEYQQEWHTSHLAPDIYYVTLLLDGEPLVRRAVKVD
jgi:hypothetical protein